MTRYDILTLLLLQAGSRNELKINHIFGSNLSHYNYLLDILSRTDDVQNLDYPVKVGGNLKSTWRIDIVADRGRTWIKVIARNPKALDDVVSGQASYGTKSILDHAESYIQAAEDNPCNFQSPNVSLLGLPYLVSLVSGTLYITVI